MPLPFASTVRYDDFVVRIKEAEVMNGRIDVYGLLANISRSRLHEMQQAMATTWPELAFRDANAFRKGNKAVLNLVKELQDK